MDEYSRDFKTKSIDKICSLFEKYRYEYNFNRRNCSDIPMVYRTDSGRQTVPAAVSINVFRGGGNQ